MVTRTWPLCLALIALLSGAAAGAAGQVPKKKKGNSASGVVTGSGFRITTIHPMRGDFSEYNRVEVAGITNGIGERISADVIEQFNQDLEASFQSSDGFSQVARIGDVAVDSSAGSPVGAGPPPVPAPEGSTRTLLVSSEVLYYKAGNRGLRAIGLGGGYHRFVVRVRLYDKELGRELGMMNLSGEVSSGFFTMPLIAGDGAARNAIVAAIVNRTDIRRAKAGQ